MREQSLNSLSSDQVCELMVLAIHEYRALKKSRAILNSLKKEKLSGKLIHKIIAERNAILKLQLSDTLERY